MTIDFTKYHQHEAATFRRSVKFLKSKNPGLEHLQLFRLIASTNASAVKSTITKEEDQLTILYIGSRLFNHGMLSYRNAMSGYYQSSFLLQRDVIEVQFLLDYFRFKPTSIRTWRESSNEDRVKNFSASTLYKQLDERDNFRDQNRKKTYQQFCELAAHVSYPGIKLMTNKDNLIEIGPFYDSHKLLNTLAELNRRYGHAVITLCSLIKQNSIGTIKLEISLMENFDKTFGLKLTEKESFKSLKSVIEEQLAN